MLVKDYGGEIDWNIGAFCGHDEMMFDIDKACKMACEKKWHQICVWQHLHNPAGWSYPTTEKSAYVRSFAQSR